MSSMTRLLPNILNEVLDRRLAGAHLAVLVDPAQMVDVRVVAVRKREYLGRHVRDHIVIVDVATLRSTNWLSVPANMPLQTRGDPNV